MSMAIKAGRMQSQGGVGRNMSVRGGDPGLFGFLGDALKTVGKVAGVIPGVGGAAGAVLGTAGGLLSGKSAAQRVSTPPISRLAPQAMPVVPTPGVSGAIQRLLPGGKTGYQVQQNGGPAMKPPSGYHYNKTSYFLKDGTYVPEGTKLVKNRRRNPMNPRALDRAIGRINSAKRVQSKLSKISTGKYTAAGNKKKC